MATAVLKRQDVVDFLRRGDAAIHLALLTQRMSCDVSVPDFSPPMVVASVDFRVTLVTPVALRILLGVCRAEPVVR
ncbi:hypothetical protein [Rothia sp. 32237D007AR]